MDRKRYELFIGGEATSVAGSDRYLPTYNPYNQEVWAKIRQATDADVRAAIAAARKAFPAWKRTSGTERSRLLHRIADLIDRDAKRLAELETTDNGKVIRETINQMGFSARNYRFFAGFADKLYGSYIPLDSPTMVDFASWEPMGVCALLTAWNSPMQLLSNKLAAALAAGNTVVIKPSEFASATTVEFAHLAAEAGVPAGVVNVVTGDARVGAALCASPGIDKISFTGGSATGRLVMQAAAQNLVPITLELGGKSPNIIFEDADLVRAVPGAVAGIFGAAGQTCMAGSRLLVQRPVYEQVVAAMVDRAAKVVMGDPMDPRTEMGPVANERQLEHILGMIQRAQAEGANLAAGGGRAQGSALGKGLFVQPTIFTGVRRDCELVRSEVFGPVLGIMPFESEEQAVELANDSAYGLVAGVWTQDVSRAHRMCKALDAGTVWVNTYRTGMAQAPAGGTKASGFGRERGWHGLLEFMHTKNVMIDFGSEVRDPFSIRTR
ncbi:MAG: aldehyde dehydrogenase [Hyphomicrobiaceae bacterium]|nr:aldehyde dehydrogenase [Hyphomicrobiaceae bacterium]